MSRLRLLRAPAVALVVVLVAGGLAFAAGQRAGSGTVTACVDTHQRLRTPTAHGSCPAGSHKVTLNKKGPRGARGPAGAAAWVLRAESTSGSDFHDRALPGMNLTLRAVCGPASQSSVYLFQDGTSVTSSYQVRGTATVSTGGTGTLVWNQGGVQNRALSGGTQPVSFDASFVGDQVASEVILTNGTASAHLVVTRGGASVDVQMDADQHAGSCSAQAVVTPLT